MLEKVKDYMFGDGWKTFDYYVGCESIFYRISFAFMCMLCGAIYGIWWIFLFVTSPIWVLPYLIFTKKL